MLTITRLAACLVAAVPLSLGASIPHRPTEFGCSAKPPDDFMAAASAMRGDEDGSRAKAFFANDTQKIEVDTYFHVIAAGNDLDDGDVTAKQLANQLVTLNKAYAPHSIQFNLKGTTRTVNANWSTDQPGAELVMKRKLRQGSYGALNMYFMKQLEDDALGYCYFPTSVTNRSADFLRDGCSINAFTVPGGSLTNFNQGQTAVHEVGHWFGLLHTFHGNSCSGSGDQIADTPAQLSATSGCPVGRDSCPNAEGKDPINNYMDYSYDSCYEEFTPNQATRMYSMFEKFRT